MKSISNLIAIASTATLASAADDKCRALVMSGGANNGAWEAGVVWGLLHYGEPTDYAYDVITGVSAGALNTGMFATWEKGDEYNMSEAISNSWASIHSNDEIFTTWNGEWPPSAEYAAKAIFTDPSILNTDNAIDFITAQIAP